MAEVKCSSAALVPSTGPNTCPDIDFDVLGPVWLHLPHHDVYIVTARNPASTRSRIEVFNKGSYRTPIASMEVSEEPSVGGR